MTAAEQETKPDLEPLDREADVLRCVVGLVEQRLPTGWELKVYSEFAPLADRRVDALLSLCAPDGSRVTVLVEAKRQLATRDVPYALEQLEGYRQTLVAQEPVVSMLVARYLSASTREHIERRGACYADATGNLRITLDRPALFLRDVGAARDPWRGPGRPPAGLKGPAAARVVRALTDFTPPVTVPQLIERSGASSGATYRVVEFLQQEALIEREPRAAITDVDWRALLERWSQDYGFQQSNPTIACLAPRGLPSLLEALRANPDLRYALTGSLAIEETISYASARLAMTYIDQANEAIDALDLRPVETGANVLLAPTDYDVVFQRTQDRDGLRLVAKSQIAVDLLTAPGRGPAEAQALLDWMSANESSWRTA